MTIFKGYIDPRVANLLTAICDEIYKEFGNTLLEVGAPSLLLTEDEIDKLKLKPKKIKVFVETEWEDR